MTDLPDENGVDRLESEELAALIVEALLRASALKQEDVDRAIRSRLRRSTREKVSVIIGPIAACEARTEGHSREGRNRGDQPAHEDRP